MGSRFSAEEWKTLTMAERITQCATMAQDAQTIADEAVPKMKEDYLQLANHWLNLARALAETEIRQNSN